MTPKKKIKGDVILEKGAKPKPHEILTAEALADAGHNVRFIPNSLIIGMADRYLDNTLFEIKAPEGSTTDCVERNLRKAVDHQSPNVIICPPLASPPHFPYHLQNPLGKKKEKK